MKPSTVGAILDAIAGFWPVAQCAEITLEANPTSVEAERFRGFKQAGVNRVSLGVQALNDADLKALGRGHTAAEALRAVELASLIFERYSFDLIYARPGQTVAGWRQELKDAITRAATISRSISSPSNMAPCSRACAMREGSCLPIMILPARFGM